MPILLACVRLRSVEAGDSRKVAVVGHVEWVQFARVARLPRAGEVAHAREPFEEPAGGGAVAAVQLARLSGAASLFTALGRDEHGERTRTRLAELGVEVFAASRSEPTRRAITLLDDRSERTIMTLGARLEPERDDARLPWLDLAAVDAVYFTAGGRAALEAARAARVLVASPRAGATLAHGVALDALVLSARDELERRAAARVEDAAELIVLTDGAHGGSYRHRDGRTGSWAAVPARADAVDSYGCGDSFAAGLTFALGAGMELHEALGLAARCGAVCLTGHGPYERQLQASELGTAADGLRRSGAPGRAR